MTCFAAPQQQQKRDAAIQAISACLQHQKASRRECRKVDQSISVLIDVYKGGDKSVLPTLLQFPQLTDFYGDAFLADPEGFLAAISLLSQKDQALAAVGLAGDMFGIRTEERFDSLREELQHIPATAPIHPAAEQCLKALERQNISFLVDYFPPRTFAGPAADFQVKGYSRKMYALGERPLWSDLPPDETTYRLTYFAALGVPAAITLSIKPAADPQLAIMRMNSDGQRAEVDGPSTISRDALTSFLAALDGARFWDAPTNLPPPKGRFEMDGAAWMIEGVKDGTYHVVVRWCPAVERQSSEEIRFGDAGLLLFQIAGLKHSGPC
jgi:hypothetical protein